MIAARDIWTGIVSHPRLIPFCRALFVLGCVVASIELLLHVVFYPTFTYRIFEDAYFFTRYAHNFLRTGVFSWNAGEGPTFGNTSQLYQLFTLAIYWLTGERQLTTLLFGSVSGGLAAAAIMLRAYWQLWGRATPRLGWIMLLVILFYLLGLQSFLRSLDTGMETTWVMALAGAFAWSAYRLEQRRDRASILIVVAITLLLYLARPDAVLLPLVTLGAALLFTRDAAWRRQLAWSLAAIAVGLVLLLVFFWIYYGMPLPLAIYGKVGPFTIYPPSLLRAYRNIMPLLFLEFISRNVLLFPGLAILLLYLDRVSAVTRGLLCAVIVFFVFHGVSTVPIMGYHARFLMPALPFVILLALQGVHLAVGQGVAVIDDQTMQRRLASPVFGGFLLALIMVGTPVAAALHANDIQQRINTGPYADEKAVLVDVSQYFRFYAGSLPKLAAAIAPDCSVATTEHGRLSALLLDNRMIDLAGLHDPNIARHGFSADLIFDRYKPDVLFAPHSHYLEWTQAVAAHPALPRDYVVFPLSREPLHFVALRRDSPCFEALRAVYQGIADRN